MATDAVAVKRSAGRRLAGLFKILVALVCLGAILQRLLPALGVGMF